jgi:hypothetical protein
VLTLNIVVALPDRVDIWGVTTNFELLMLALNRQGADPSPIGVAIDDQKNTITYFFFFC